MANGSNQWLNFNRRAGTQFAQPSFANVADADSDGDLDVLGAGVGTTKLALEEPQDDPSLDVPELAYAQVGANGPVALFQGWYQVTGFVGLAGPQTTLSYVIESPNAAQVFTEGLTEPTSLAAVPANVISVPIYFGIPEPSTYLLAGIGLVSLVIAKRRKNKHLLRFRER